MDKTELIKDLENLLGKGNPWGLSDRLKKYIAELKKTYVPKQRTSSQNSALHKFCELLATSLNDAGLPMQKVLKVDVDWTPSSVKEYIWRPVQKALYHKESTTELNKLGEIEQIHAIIMRELGEKWQIEYIDFPHNPEKGQDWSDGARALTVKYPTEEVGEPIL